MTEFVNAHEGWCAANGVVKKGPAITRERIEELKRLHG